MQLEIYELGAPVGLLQIEQQGLYRVCRAQCRPSAAGVCRLYLWQAQQCVCMGVPVPAEDGLSLTRRLSAAALPFLPQTAVLGRAEGGWLPWRGSFAGIPVEGGYLDPTKPLLAVPQQAQSAAALAKQLKQLATQKIGGVDCLIFTEQAEEQTAELPAPEPTAAEEMAESTATEEAPEPKATEETAEPAATEKAPEPAAAEETAEPAATEEAPELAAAVETAEPAAAEQAPEPATAEWIPEASLPAPVFAEEPAPFAEPATRQAQGGRQTTEPAAPYTRFHTRAD